MPGEDEHHYELEPRPDNQPDASPPNSDASDVHALDVCPNCGAPMRETDSLLCLRCGYDLKSLSVTRTEVGHEEAPADDEETDETQKPIIVEGLGGFILPEVIAALAAVILGAGYLAGTRGLVGGADEISLLACLIELIRFMLRVAVLTACSLGAVFALSHLLKRPLGDIKLGAVRLLAVIVCVQLMTFLSLPNHPGWEWTIELILQLAAYLGLIMLMLRLTIQQAATVAGITSLAILALLLVANSVTWSLVPSPVS